MHVVICRTGIIGGEGEGVDHKSHALVFGGVDSQGQMHR